ncbi:MAG: class I SAM-dependent methyltransferase [Verrucomicrobia bacterium]|nr:class I SAM-dependent methyltransferase [Verrucomicrobiota bacterium]
MNPSFPDHFSGVAGRYADFRPHYPAELFDYLATLAPRDATVWDCAAGNGQATRGLAQRFAHVVATDASPEQIVAAPALPNAGFRVALAEESGLPDRSVALVTVAQALHWFDLPRFYAEVNRVLRPGGVLAVWAYGVNRVEGAAVDALVQEFYGGLLGPYWPPSRKLVETGYRTLPFHFTEIAAPVFTMEVRWTMAHLLGYFGTWSATSRYIKATGQNPLGALAEKLAPVWGDPTAPRRVTWPLTLRVGRVARDE